MDAQTAGHKAKAFEPRNLVFYFLIVYGLQIIAFGLYGVGILKVPPNSGTGPAVLLQNPFLILFTVANWAPSITAFVLTALTEGKSGVSTLWRRFWNKNLTLRWLLVILLFLPALELVTNLIIRLLDGKAYPLFASYNPAWIFIPALISAFIFNGVTEEFGWRGYVLPRFQAKWNALVSSIILGVLWSIWHLGQWLMPGSFLYQHNFWLYTLGTILLTILMTWIFNNTGGSVLGAVLFHAIQDTSIFWFQADWRFYAVLLLAVIVIVIVFGPENLVRRRPEQAPSKEKYSGSGVYPRGA